jgi:hypothetical protein
VSGERPWRVGRRIPIHLYDANDVPLGTMLTAADAKLAVAAVNARGTEKPTRPRKKRKVAP